MNLAWFEKIKNQFQKIYPLFFTFVFVIILLQYSFGTLESIFYDYWIKYNFNYLKENPVVVITMDEESDQFLGESYPYSYATHNRFLNSLLKQKPLLVNYFVPFSESQNPVDEKYSLEFKDRLTQFSSEGGDVRFSTDTIDNTHSPQIIKDVGQSVGLLTIESGDLEKDMTVRRALVSFAGNESIHLWSANKYLQAKGEKKISVNQIKGASYNLEKDAVFAFFRYAFSTKEINTQNTTIPFHRVLIGNYPQGFFQNKIVLIGAKYYSEEDTFVSTPYDSKGEKSPKMFVHAQIINALIHHKTIYPLPEIFSKIFAVLIAFFLSYLISKINPQKGLYATIGLILFIFFVSYFLFIFAGVWFKISHIMLTIFIVYYIWVPFRAIIEYQNRYKIEEETKIIKRVDQIKQNFISLMSHDLKTPVAKISGLVEILTMQYENSPKQKEMLGHIMNSTKELDNFINSILDLTKVESRNVILNKSNKDVNTIIEAVVDRLEYESQAQGITLEKNLSPLYPIEIDVNLINRVISNLVENALKYAGEGSTVVISTWDDKDFVYIEIKDNGVGIQEDDLKNIFEKFYRVRNDSVHKVKGSGLGLYLVKYFIELHHGEINVFSKPSEGTKFIIKLINA